MPKNKELGRMIVCVCARVSERKRVREEVRENEQASERKEGRITNAF